jgi:TonB family protein
VTSPIQEKEPDVSLALVRAASGGDLDAVKTLLAAGADVNCANESGQTALILAAVMGHAEVVVHLISAGADPRLQDGLNLTALEWSTRRGFSDVSQFLTRVSPPLRESRSERTTDSKKTDGDTQSSAAITKDAEAPKLGTPPATETSATTTEKEPSAELQTLAPQPGLLETSTSEYPGLRVAVETDSATPVPSIDHSPALVPNEPEVELPSAELATDSVTPLPSVDHSPALVANEPEVELPSAELAADSATPLSSIDHSPALVPNEPEVELPSAELAAESATPLSSIDHSPALVPNEPEVELPSAELATDSATPLPSIDYSPALVPNEPESQPASAELATDSVTPPPSVEHSPAVVAHEPESQPASAESEIQSASTIEPSSEAEDTIVTTASTPNLESLDPDPDAPAVSSSRQPLLLHEEDETIPRRAVPASVFDFRLPDEPAPAASARTGAGPAPGIPVPAQRNRAAAFSGSPLGLSNAQTDEKKADDVPNLRRCPRCGAVYQNSPLSFCTRDNATLISINELHQLATPPQTSSTPIAVWLLIAFVLGASGFAAYRLTERFYRQPEPAPAEVKPIEAPPVTKKPAFSVGGDLAGSEVNIPEPEYPSDLMTADITGPITVRVRVNKNGRVISALTSKGDSRLRAAAVKAARLATFAPDKLAEMSPRGRAVAGSITYDFAAPQTNAVPSPSTTSPTSTSSPGASAVPSSSATPNPDPDAPVVSNELMSAAINVPAPDYPTRAKRAGTGGAITVTIRVNRAGKVISWRSSAGDSQLRAAAIKAVRKATFSREKLPGNGDVVGTITYNFTP